MKDIAVADWTSPLSGYGPSPDGSVILLLRKKNVVKDTADSGKKLQMKNILLLSDTHGHIDEKMLGYASHADEIWHAGDIGDLHVSDELKKIKPLRAVYGNIDGAQARLEFPLDNRFECEGVDVWITHIAGYPTRYNGRINKVLRLNPPILLICGHSHIL